MIYARDEEGRYREATRALKFNIWEIKKLFYKVQKLKEFREIKIFQIQRVNGSEKCTSDWQPTSRRPALAARAPSALDKIDIQWVYFSIGFEVHFSVSQFFSCRYICTTAACVCDVK